jgi:hypothetical protein
MLGIHPPDVSSAAAGMRAWLASGAVQSPSGAFYAWRDEGGRPSFEYPEITGYALTHFAGLADPSEQEVAAGLHAARWLLDRLEHNDLSARGSWDGQAVYTFDLAMIATGLMAFGSRHAIDEMVTHGTGLARAIEEEISETGTLRSIPPRSGTSSARSAWSTEGLAHLVKTVQCLMWADELGVEGCAKAASTLIAESRTAQREDGRFITHPSDQETMLHPHLYAVEGLWMFGTASGDASALGRAEAATRWAWGHQRASGAFPRWVAASSDDEAPDQADLTAQALRAAVLTDVAGDCRAATAEWLAGTAVRFEDGGAAACYQPGSGTCHHNTWATLFAAQALRAHLEGPESVSWRTLV